MKILILSITAGQGHHATGEALRSYFVQKGFACDVLDTYEHIAPALKELIAQGYLISTARAPKAYGEFYRIISKKNRPSDSISITNILNTTLTNQIQDYIRDYKADAVIATHPLSACIMNVMRKRGLMDCPTVDIITDFTVLPLTQELTELDYFVTGTEMLEYSLEKKGIPSSKVLPFGIPIHPKFSVRGDKTEARRSLGLDPDKATILIMSGSMGYGKIDRSIAVLDDMSLDFQAMVVCGNNEKIKNKLEKMPLKKDFRIFGFVGNVDQMMDASDCIVTKPGGLTSSEALAKELPMILVNPIPGQEMRNTEFLLNSGAALYSTPTFPLDEAVYTLFSGAHRLENIRNAIKAVSKKDSTKKICEFIIDRINERA